MASLDGEALCPRLTLHQAQILFMTDEPLEEMLNV
jgi:hypothetical protein